MVLSTEPVMSKQRKHYFLVMHKTSGQSAGGRDEKNEGGEGERKQNFSLKHFFFGYVQCAGKAAGGKHPPPNNFSAECFYP